MLEGAFVPDHLVSRMVPPAGMDAFVLSMFAWFLVGVSNIYYGIARRAYDLAIPAARARTSIALTRSMAYHPGIQQAAADLTFLLEPVAPHLEQIAQDRVSGVDHGGAWPLKLIAGKYHATESCWRIVDTALEMSGGIGMFRSNELEQLFRDARCGRLHPANTYLVHEIVGKIALGIDLGEQPRWG